jgi:putative transposase
VKRISRLYSADGLAVRTKVRTKIARRTRTDSGSHRKVVNGFVAARVLEGRWFGVPTVTDQFTRECLLLLADSSLIREKVATALSVVIAGRGRKARSQWIKGLNSEAGREFFQVCKSFT